MRPIANFTLHALLAAAIAALAASSAAAAPASLKLGGPPEGTAGRDHRGEIEVASWSFGPIGDGARVSKVDGFAIKQGAARSAGSGGTNQILMNDTAGKAQDPSSHGTWIADVERPQVAERSDPVETFLFKMNVESPRDVASGQARGKRGAPPAQGVLTVAGTLPDCAVGDSISEAALQTAEARYDLSGLVITGCTPGNLTLRYAKVVVIGS
jgi:hypothetical protein